MLKFLLLELIKSYTTNTVKEEKHYSNYFVGAFSVAALILLIVADYIVICNEVVYMPYLKSLILVSSTLLLSAVIIKSFSLWFNWQSKNQSLSVSDGAKIVPVVISMIPMYVVAYIMWTKIQVKFPGKAAKLKSVLQRLL